MPSKKLTLSVSEPDWQLIQRARGNLSLSGFLLRCTLKVIAQEIHLTHHAPDRHERNKAAVLRFLEQGCVSVEDIESHAFSLSQTEIETYLFELEQEGRIRRQKAKRGRMWRWDVI
jgi:predicted Rossmann fold nucleotide-binding protein DprA/Smf involved in DNA uptake